MTREQFEGFLDELYPANKPTHHVQRLKCGTGGELDGDPRPIALYDCPRSKNYRAGDSYSHHHSDIHRSRPTPGTVTVVERYLHDRNPDHAYVFWPLGEKWVSAEPRPATQEEIDSFVKLCTDRLARECRF